MPYRTVGAITSRIQEIQSTMLFETMPLKKEKELMSELKELEKCKIKVKKLEEMEGQLGNSSAETYKTTLKEIGAAQYQCREEKRNLYMKIQDLTIARKAETGDVS